MKKKFYLVLDVETANSLEDALVYDIGYAVIDNKGHIYTTASYVVRDIFIKEKDLMQTAYYAEKIPMYWDEIKKHNFIVSDFYTVRRDLCDTIKQYNIKTVCAYNAHFDYTALNTTERWVTKSKYRYFLPYGIEVNCIWHMACQVICTQKKYIRWCIENNYVSPSGNIKTSAEIVHRFLSQDTDFIEAHTGLQDVLIEADIFARCIAKHKKMDRNINRQCWKIPTKRAKEMGMIS